MDWIFILQTLLFGLYITSIYNLEKSEVGELRKGEIYKNKFWTKFYLSILFSVIILGFLGGIFVFTLIPIMSNIENLYFGGISNDWKIFTFLILIVSLISLIRLMNNHAKKELYRKYIQQINGTAYSISSTILEKAIDRNLQGYISIEDLKKIVAMEQETFIKQKKSSPFENNEQEVYYKRNRF